MYSGIFSKWVTSLFIVALFFFGCGGTPTGPEPGGGSWDDLSDDEKNEKILEEAEAWINKEGGQCKEWIQKVVNIVSGYGGPSYLPLNYIKAGDPYNKARWLDSPNVKVVWQRAYQTPAEFPHVNSVLFPPEELIKPGNIIQYRKQGDYNNAVDSTGLHTALIKFVDSQTMTWIDSNWYGQGQVRRHDFSLSDWAAKIEAWTVYQIK